MTEIVISGRFNGPPASANGGYTCGTVAQLLGGGPAEVRLRRPPPLDRPLRWDGARLLDGDEVVAEGRRLDPDEGPVGLPPPVPLEVARAATSHYPGFADHPFPTCFTCGPDRAEGDGLRLFAGPVDEVEGAGTGEGGPGSTGAGAEAPVAAPWVPQPSLLVGGEVPVPVVWAALDCPGGWAGLGRVEGTFMLGTMRGSVTRAVEVGADHVVTGWMIGIEGRKLSCGSALRTTSGEVVGWSHQTWVRIA